MFVYPKIIPQQWGRKCAGRCLHFVQALEQPKLRKTGYRYAGAWSLISFLFYVAGITNGIFACPHPTLPHPAPRQLNLNSFRHSNHEQGTPFADRNSPQEKFAGTHAAHRASVPLRVAHKTGKTTTMLGARGGKASFFPVSHRQCSRSCFMKRST